MLVPDWTAITSAPIATAKIAGSTPRTNNTAHHAAASLASAILERPDLFVQAFTEKLMTYALGRPLRARDMPAVRRIVREAAPQEYRLESLVRGIVTSDAFRKRRLQQETAAGASHVAQSGAGR